MENSSEIKQEKKTWETPDVETIEIEDGTQAGGAGQLTGELIHNSSD